MSHATVLTKPFWLFYFVRFRKKYLKLGLNFLCHIEKVQDLKAFLQEMCWNCSGIKNNGEMVVAEKWVCREKNYLYWLYW